MIESGYYPMGAENDPRAPWNQNGELPTPVSKKCKVTEMLVRDVYLETQDYYKVVEPENNLIEYDYLDTDWRAKYEEEFYNAKELLDMFHYLLVDMKNKGVKSLQQKDGYSIPIAKLIEDTQGWGYDPDGWYYDEETETDMVVD